MPKKITLKSQIVEMHNLHKDFDPLQLSGVLREKNITASAVYIDQVVREYKEKTAKMGLDMDKPSELTFVKVDENPNKTKAVEEAGKEAKSQKEHEEKPKKIEGKIKEPTAEDIQRLHTAKAMEKPELMQAIMSGKAKPIIASIITVENYLFKKLVNYEHDKDTTESLINTWSPILEGYLKKLEGGNSTLYVALITTLVLHIPVILALLEKYAPILGKKMEPKKEEKING